MIVENWELAMVGSCENIPFVLVTQFDTEQDRVVKTIAVHVETPVKWAFLMRLMEGAGCSAETTEAVECALDGIRLEETFRVFSLT